MTALATAAARTRTAARPLTLDERLALTDLAMNSRLDSAAADHLIRTAHIDIPEILVDPAPATRPRPTTVEQVFAEAARLIEAHGWIRRYLGSPDTGYCLLGAIRAAAGGEGPLDDEAGEEIFKRILQRAPVALSAGGWNDAQSGPGPVLRILGG